MQLQAKQLQHSNGQSQLQCRLSSLKFRQKPNADTCEGSRVLQCHARFFSSLANQLADLNCVVNFDHRCVPDREYLGRSGRRLEKMSRAGTIGWAGSFVKLFFPDRDFLSLYGKPGGPFCRNGLSPQGELEFQFAMVKNLYATGDVRQWIFCSARGSDMNVQATVISSLRRRIWSHF
jgi:hypothetical protein